MKRTGMTGTLVHTGNPHALPTRLTYTPTTRKSPLRRLRRTVSSDNINTTSATQSRPSRGVNDTVNDRTAHTSSAYVMDAEKYVSDARRELVEAINDGEQSPILTLKVEELARAEGELQAFKDWGEYAVRYPPGEVLVRLSETLHDPVLLHDVRRAGYARAVSHIFRGSSIPGTVPTAPEGN